MILIIFITHYLIKNNEKEGFQFKIDDVPASIGSEEPTDVKQEESSNSDELYRYLFKNKSFSKVFEPKVAEEIMFDGVTAYDSADLFYSL